MSDFHFGDQANVKNVVMALKERMHSPGADTDFVESAYKPDYKSKILNLDSHDKLATFAAAKFCFDNRDAADRILITGDLARTGRDKDLNAARHYVFDTPRQFFFDTGGNASLGRAGIKYIVLAGNHDRYSDITGTPGGRVFDQYFGNLTGDQSGAYLNTINKDGVRLGVVCCDFTLRSAADAQNFPSIHALTEGRFGQGRAYTDIISRAASLTREARDAGCTFVLWAIHFAPFECGDELRLVDYPAVLDAAEASGVRLIICGHTHRRATITLGKTVIACAGTVSCVNKKRDYTIHILDFKLRSRKFEVMRENFEFSSHSGEFEFSDVERLM